MKLLRFFVIYFFLSFFSSFIFKSDVLATSHLYPCSAIVSPKDCSISCSPYKVNGQSFQCRWNYNLQKCSETSKTCSDGEVITSSCTRIADKTYKCIAPFSGTITHWSCNKTKPAISVCDLSHGGTSKIEGTQTGGQVFVIKFDGSLQDCGSEQFDFCDKANGCFISRFGPEECKPTPRPSIVPKTPLPTAETLMCRNMVVYVNSVIVSEIKDLKIGDLIIFKGFTNKTTATVKSFTFDLFLDNVRVERKIVPAIYNKTSGLWTSNYVYTIKEFGHYRVVISSINQ